jgi:hypothetical protein
MIETSWIKGEDFTAEELKQDSPTFGIHKVKDGVIIHFNAIEVYTSVEDRDHLLKKLTPTWDLTNFEYPQALSEPTGSK